MSALLDTNIIIRYVTGDPPAEALIAKDIIDNEPDLMVTAHILAEVAFVLGSVTYNVEREAIVDTLVDFLDKENVMTFGVPKDVVVESLWLCRPSRRVSFADALLWASARTTGHPVYTFDRRFPTDGIEVRRR